MMTKKIKSRRLFILLLFMPVFIFYGCGYSIHGRHSLPFTEIQIGLIENKTLEPKLQDKLHKALIEEFLKQGISVNPFAGLRFTGVINEFDLAGLSEKDDVMVEYRVIINADFRVADEKGFTREIKKISSPFIVSFTASKDLGSLIATKDIAEERALRDVAMRIVGALIY